MIARIWHGWTAPGDADAYEELLRSTILPGIEGREGYRGAYLLRRIEEESEGEVEFVTITTFDSMDAVRAFSHDGERGAVVPAEARDLLSHFDLRSVHYEMVLQPGDFAGGEGQLQDDGLVRQRELPPPSSSTVYELTEQGESLRPVVKELIRWGGRWMVSGAGDDVFRGEWLALALEALGAGVGLERERLIRFESGSGGTTLSLGGERVAVSSDGEPELVVRGDPALMLGMAAGAVPLSSAAEALDLHPPGEASITLLSRALAPSGSAEGTAVIEGPIRWRLNVPASRERVYEALSTDEGRRGFWAETHTDADGCIRFVFPNGVEYEGRVLESRPPELFALEYFGGVARFELTSDGRGGTDLHLTHTGLVGDEWIETHAGWLNVLFPLKAVVAHGVDLRTHDPQRNWDHGFVDG